MKIAGMTRISEYDIEKKKCGEEMKFSITDLSNHCEIIYFLMIGKIDASFLDWIKALDIKKVITYADKTYFGEGFNFDWTASLTDLLNTIDESEHYDWILFPDTDDVLPPNIIDEIHKADINGFDLIECPILECFDGIDNVICRYDDGYPIGPHIKAFKYNKDLTFIGSPGFSFPVSKTGRILKNFHSQYSCRHLRYSNKNLIENRVQIGYYQEYYLRSHPTVKYNPQWTFNEYVNYGRDL